MRKAALISTLSLVSSCVAIAAFVAVPLSRPLSPQRRQRPTRSGRGRSRPPSRATSSTAARSRASSTTISSRPSSRPAMDFTVSSCPHAELEARSRQALSREDDARAQELRRAGRRQEVELGVVCRQGREIHRRAPRRKSALNVVGAGATIRVPLDKSADAFDRLDQCVTKNERAVETNPFVAPARRP